MLGATLLGHWMPLTWLSFGLNFALGGMDPWGYHAGNLLLHAINAALLYLCARRLIAAGLGQPWTLPAVALGAAVAALAFAAHPLRAESVAWITQRRDVLCACFYLLAVLAHLRGAAAGGVVRGGWLVVSLAALAGALLSKSIAMTLPLTLLVLDVYPLGRLRLGWWVLVREKLPHAALAAAGAAVAVVAVSRGAGWTSYAEYGISARIAMVGYSLWFYPASLAWPDALSPLYELPARVDPGQPRFALALAAFAGVTLALLAVRRWFPGGVAAWAHSAIVLAPVAGVVHAGNQLAHDRYSYLSGLGFAVLIGAGASWTIRAWQAGRLRPWLAVAVLAVAALMLVGWGAATWRQSRIWLDSEALWRGAIAADPGCAICHNNLGAALMDAPRARGASLDEAEQHLRESVRLGPRHPAAYMANLGRLLVIRRRPAEALDPLRQAVALEPRNVLARYWLARAYQTMERHERAEQEIATLARLDPVLAAELRKRP